VSQLHDIRQRGDAADQRLGPPVQLLELGLGILVP
jgi:hypothetical protein